MLEVVLLASLHRMDSVKRLGIEVQVQGVERFLPAASLLGLDFVLAFGDLDSLPGGPSQALDCVTDIGLVAEDLLLSGPSPGQGF
jgi:hypothetical protein